MIQQLFSREPTDEELNIILKCYGLEKLYDDRFISYLTINVKNTIEKLYGILDLLIDIYLPCKYKFLYSSTPKRTITILRQIVRLYDCRVVKYVFNKSTYYKIEKNEIDKKIKIEKNICLKF